MDGSHSPDFEKIQQQQQFLRAAEASNKHWVPFVSLLVFVNVDLLLLVLCTFCLAASILVVQCSVCLLLGYWAFFLFNVYWLCCCLLFITLLFNSNILGFIIVAEKVLLLMRKRVSSITCVGIGLMCFIYFSTFFKRCFSIVFPLLKSKQHNIFRVSTHLLLLAAD